MLDAGSKGPSRRKSWWKRIEKAAVTTVSFCSGNMYRRQDQIKKEVGDRNCINSFFLSVAVRQKPVNDLANVDPFQGRARQHDPSAFTQASQQKGRPSQLRGGGDDDLFLADRGHTHGLSVM